MNVINKLNKSLDESQSMAISLDQMEETQEKRDGTRTENALNKDLSQESLLEHFASKYYTEKGFKAMGNIVSSISIK